MARKCHIRFFFIKNFKDIFFKPISYWGHKLFIDNYHVFFIYTISKSKAKPQHSGLLCIEKICSRLLLKLGLL